jgi:small subunit ribosomal protein S33
MVVRPDIGAIEEVWRVTCYLAAVVSRRRRDEPTLKYTMASIAPSRLAALTRLRSVIFQTSYNPTSQRTGAKYLKRRLRGPSMIEYYPHQLSISAINKEFQGLDLIDEDEVQRLQDVEDKKKRGKGAPKKAKSAGKHWQSYRLSLFC